MVALLHWPMSRLRGAHAVPSQLKELMRLSEAWAPDRELRGDLDAPLSGGNRAGARPHR